MANYNVGNIEIGLISNTGTVVKDIDLLIRQINKIERLDKAVQDSFNSINKLGNGLNKIERIKMEGIANQFERISLSTKKLNTELNGIEQPKFTETATQLNKLANAFRHFEKINDYDFTKIQGSFEKLNTIITPFLEKLKESESSLVAMSNVLKSLKTNTIEKAKNEISKVDKESKKASVNINKMFSIGKIYWFINYTKRLFAVFGKIINASIDFEETLNKFQVSFGIMSDDAEKFANKLTYAFNLSRQSIMDYMSTFNSMLKSLGGLDVEQSFNLSKTLTQLALDYSSLFNVTVDSAMKSFQSVLSGQIRSIRSVSGIDVSENTIFQYYQELGGEKTMRQLSQLEKRLLRIYALEKQMNELGAIGDLEKTINSASNVIKQISETVEELFVYLGNLAQEFFKPLLTNILAVLLVAKDLAKYLADIKGLVTVEYEQGKNDLFGEISNSADEASESVDGLLGKLSFDKFEALSKSTSVSSDLSKIVQAIALYNSSLESIKSNSRNIADNFLSWLGFIQEIDPITGETNLKLKDGYTNLEKIKDIALQLLSLGIGYAIVRLISNFTLLNLSVRTLNIALGTILIASIINLTLNWDKLSNTAKALNIVVIALSTTFLILRNRLLLVAIIGKLVIAVKALSSAFVILMVAIKGVALQLLSFSLMIGMIVGAVAIFSYMDTWNEKTKLLVGVLGTLTSVLIGAAGAWLALNGVISMGTAIPVIIGSIAVGIASMKSLLDGLKEVKAYANGGLVSRGQLFIANEKGAELVGNFGNSTGVANNDMIVKAIENASYRGFVRAMGTQDNSNNITLNLGNDSAVARALFEPLIEEANRKGYRIVKA